jgi:hypothetical protein
MYDMLVANDEDEIKRIQDNLQCSIDTAILKLFERRFQNFDKNLSEELNVEQNKKKDSKPKIIVHSFNSVVSERRKIATHKYINSAVIKLIKLQCKVLIF